MRKQVFTRSTSLTVMVKVTLKMCQSLVLQRCTNQLIATTCEPLLILYVLLKTNTLTTLSAVICYTKLLISVLTRSLPSNVNLSYLHNANGSKTKENKYISSISILTHWLIS